MVRGIPKEIADMKDEIESIQEFINNADRLADAEEDNKSHGIRATIKQLIEASFRVEDVIDEYIVNEEQQTPDPGCAAGAILFNTMILRLKVAYTIQSIKTRINEIKVTSEKDRGFQIQSSSEQGSSSSAVNPNSTLLENLRKAPLYMDENDVVGFEEPKDILIGWLVKGRAELTVVSVVAMGGQGKTTLAKKVFDNVKVVERFEYRVWITVSQPYSVEGLLRDMLQK
jgi:disease resistance protein RPM1